MDEPGLIEASDVEAIKRKMAEMENRAPIHLIEANMGPNYFLAFNVQSLPDSR